MADDDSATRKILKRFFQRAERFHVQIVGRFVEQEHITARRQHLGHVHAVAFAA
jgi:chloramphenicol 3-O-phosphotransferase